MNIIYEKNRIKGNIIGNPEFYHLERKSKEEPFQLTDSKGERFIIKGMNNLEETNLKYENNYEIWKQKYGERDKWISNTVCELKELGFNTLGYTRDIVTSDNRLSRAWGVDEASNRDIPYCVYIDICEFEDYTKHVHYPEPESKQFAMLVDWYGRSVCVEHMNNPNCIGYFLADSPAWERHPDGYDFKEILDRVTYKPGTHNNDGSVATDENSRGFATRQYRDADDLQRNIELYPLAHSYYDLVEAAIRKYDPNHLIFGDKFNVNRGVPSSVLVAHGIFMDMLSVKISVSNDKEFEELVERIDEYSQFVQKPVIIADFKVNIKDEETMLESYTRYMKILQDKSWYNGYFYAGLMDTPYRTWGLKNVNDEMKINIAEAIKRINI